MRLTKLNVFIVLSSLCFLTMYKSWDYLHSDKYVRSDIVIKNLTRLDYCSNYSKQLVGLVRVLIENKTEYELEDMFSDYGIEYGGKWSPKNCVPQTQIAILIPYRNRYEHLIHFLHNMYPTLVRQEISFGIYLIEPVPEITFNRGILFNIGFLESNKDGNNIWSCHAYHDVDLILENDKLLYRCYDNPFHLAYRMSKHGYKPTYKGYFGGANILKKEHYQLINGFSNAYFGWGAEDDDFRTRVVAKNLSVLIPSSVDDRYFMHKHKQEKQNPVRRKILKLAVKRQDYEGLNSLKYRLVSIQKTPLYTKFLVYYNEVEIMSKINYTVDNEKKENKSTTTSIATSKFNETLSEE